jgi:hypothetical protein
MTWLEMASVDREEGLNRLAVEPMFDGCRQDSHFQALVHQLGLVE